MDVDSRIFWRTMSVMVSATLAGIIELEETLRMSKSSMAAAALFSGAMMSAEAVPMMSSYLEAFVEIIEIMHI